VHPDFSDSTLILVGHGSTLNADSARPTWQHADELRRRGVFGQVVEAFWKLEPNFGAALRAARCRRVFIVPLFISEGYFTEEVIPREMGFPLGDGPTFPRRRDDDGRTFYYCGPVGTHESMTEVLMARADEVVARHPFPHAPDRSNRSVFIAGHGTGNNDNSRKAIERQVDLIRATGRYADVHAVFMEEAPLIASCWESATTRNLVMVPFFISDGLHSYEDIPMMLGEPERVVRQRLAEGVPTWRNPTEKNGKRLWYSRSIGDEPHIADVILQRAREAADVSA
jgi:sirohydrochlorin cobaltochelatase